MSASNCGFPDGVAHPHVDACYRAGRRELADAVRAVIAEPDDTQRWPVQPYTDPGSDDEVVEVQVVNVARLKALLDHEGRTGGES